MPCQDYFIYFDKVSLCNPGYSGTRLASELYRSSALASRVLELKVCTTVPSYRTNCITEKRGENGHSHKFQLEGTICTKLIHIKGEQLV